MFLDEQFFIITHIKIRFQARYSYKIGKILERKILQEALEKIFKKKVKIYIKAPKGSKKFLDLAKLNSKQTLKNLENKEPTMKVAFDELIQKFKLNIINPVLDCVDISHHSGSNPKAGIIRFDINGPNKKFYRAYNLLKNSVGMILDR